jgi:hypothetical protein
MKNKKEKINPKFLEALKNVIIYEKKENDRTYPGRRERRHSIVDENITIDGFVIKKSSSKKIKETCLEELYLYNEWCSGGISGGNCWGDDNHYAVEGESEPEFTDLDNILNEICPNITYLQYKKLISKVIKEEDSYTQIEYYGNSTIYSYKTILLKDLYDALKELNIL